MPSKSHHKTFDFILDKVNDKLQQIDSLKDDSPNLPSAIDSFLYAVVEAYEIIRDLSSADKQQVSLELANAREMCVKCNAELKGGLFSGSQWKFSASGLAKTVRQIAGETRRAQIMKQLELCERNLTGINECNFNEIILNYFKRLLDNTGLMLQCLHKQLGLGTLYSENAHRHLLLCASQLQKCFPLLLEALEDINPDRFIEPKKYVTKRMHTCIKEIKKVAMGSNDCLRDDVSGGMFILQMDQLLSLLAVFELESDWRKLVDQLLSNAMTTAQVASPLDCKLINASCQKILRESENLKKEVETNGKITENCKLHANLLGDALESLEQRVCAAVLRMYLEVFSEPCKPLQELLIKCISRSKLGEHRQASDLTSHIAYLDAHTERLVQVALFAISCSEDTARVLGIRSCLASLESLELHLVPALSAFYIQQLPQQHSLSCLLAKHWRGEVEQLGRFIEGIVDTAALAQVTHDVVWVPAATLKKAQIKQNEVPREELVALLSAVSHQSAVLVRQVEATLKELDPNRNSPLSVAAVNLQRAVGECSALLQLVKETDVELGRIVTRCELLVTTIKKLQPLFEEEELPATIDNGSSKRLNLSSPDAGDVSHVFSQPGFVNKFNTPNRAKQYARLGLPPDADIDLDITEGDDTNANPLFTSVSTHPLSTSILYKECPSQPLLTPMSACRVKPRSRLFSRDSFLQTPRQNLLQQTLSLDVTNILEKLTGLSQTLRSQSPVIPSSSDFPPPCYNKTLGSTSRNCVQECNAHNSLRNNNEISRASVVSQNIDTPERLSDLEHLQQRIEAVRMSAKARGSDI